MAAPRSWLFLLYIGANLAIFYHPFKEMMGLVFTSELYCHWNRTLFDRERARDLTGPKRYLALMAYLAEEGFTFDLKARDAIGGNECF